MVPFCRDRPRSVAQRHVESALFLKDKDLVEAGIEGLGMLCNTMVAEPSCNDFDRAAR